MLLKQGESSRISVPHMCDPDSFSSESTGAGGQSGTPPQATPEPGAISLKKVIDDLATVQAALDKQEMYSILLFYFMDADTAKNVLRASRQEQQAKADQEALTSLQVRMDQMEKKLDLILQGIGAGALGALGAERRAAESG